MTRLLAIAAAIVTLGGAAGAIVQWSPFAWSSDMRQVAQVAYETAIQQKTSELIQVAFLLAQARAAGDHDAIAFYQIREAELQRDIAWLQAQQHGTGQ